MFKRNLTVGLLSVICLAACACTDDSKHDDNDSACKELKCDQIVGDGHAHVCAVISGKAECKNTCLGVAEGANKAVCFSNGSLPPESRPVYSSVDTCAKDDNGVLYSVSTNDTNCDNGCDESTGLCKKGGNNDDDIKAKCAELKCDQIVGDGHAHVCAVISGKAECKNTCLGAAEGANKAVCFVNGSLPPDSQVYYSVADTCAKDDNGVLYSVSTNDTQCDNGCDESTGLCKKPQVSCDMDCRVMDKREEACFVINGKAECKETCLADKEGKNGPLCYMLSGFAPSYDPDSVEDNCKKDDNGYLYSIGTEVLDDCENGCDESTGLCKPVNEDPDPECEALHCEQIVGDGKAHICVTISGKKSCEYVCRGKYESTNGAVCFVNNSLPPESREYSSERDVCEKDDNGKLYAVNTLVTRCDSTGCDESTGLCKNGGVESCSLSCINDGGDPEVCVKTEEGDKCRYACLGISEGRNAPVCYENGSLPPDARVKASVIDICAKDSSGTLYSTERSYERCDNGCDESTGLCKNGGV